MGALFIMTLYTRIICVCVAAMAIIYHCFLLAGENLVGEGAGLFEEPPSEVAPPPQQPPHLQHQRPGKSYQFFPKVNKLD